MHLYCTDGSYGTDDGYSDDNESDEEDSLNIDFEMDLFITTDNAANISKAVQESDFSHVRCFAHTLNLAVQKGLKVNGINTQLSKIRQIARYFHKSNKGKYALQVSIRTHQTIV